VQTLQSSISRIAPVWAAVVLVAAACSTSSAPPPIEYDTRGELPVTADGLHRIHSMRVAAVYLKPGASFTGYKQIVIDPVTVSYKSPPRQATASNRSRGNFALSDEDMARLKRTFQEVFEEELAKSDDYQLVTETGPDALRVTGHIVDLVVDAPPQRGATYNFVMKAGEMTLIMDVRDSITGEPLARVADRRAVRPAGGASTLHYSTPVRSWGEVRRRFQTWAALLREGLDELNQLPEVPLPPSTPAP
jgi:hypothetical protein